MEVVQHEGAALRVFQFEVLDEGTRRVADLLERPFARDQDVLSNGQAPPQVVVHIVAFLQIKVLQGQTARGCCRFRFLPCLGHRCLPFTGSIRRNVPTLLCDVSVRGLMRRGQRPSDAAA